MLRIGITGGIGSGKTLICTIFHKLGIPVFNADDEAKALLDIAAVKDEITRICGNNILTSEGIIDHKKLAKVIFNNQKLLNEVNSVIHPLVKKKFVNWAVINSNSPFVIEEAALIFESFEQQNLDYTILVYAPVEVRIKRVMQRDSSTRENILDRIKNQMPEEDKIKLADFVIFNADKQLVMPQVLKLYNHFHEIEQ